MKVLGIIAEYNPFHNGHKYHLEHSINKVGATHSIAIMSGNFLQRGEPSLLDKWERAEMSIKEGVDLVIELPTLFGCNSAEFFAKGAINLLDALNIVDYISFGSEEGNIDKLKIISKTLINESDEYKYILKKYLSTGITYPKAREEAVKEYLKGKYEISHILNNPNNILGVEYLKALYEINSKIQPITIKRIKADYNSTEINSEICSATAIRNLLMREIDKLTLKRVVPKESYKMIMKNINEGKGPNFIQNLEMLILYKLRTMNIKDIKNIHDVEEGLENRIKRAATISNSYHQLIDNIKTKRYPLTRIQRILMKTLIGINKRDVDVFKKDCRPKYIRILGMSSKGRELINKIKKNSDIPIIVNLKHYRPQDPIANRLLEIDLIATDVYNLLNNEQIHRKGGDDFTKRPYIEFNQQEIKGEND